MSSYMNVLKLATTASLTNLLPRRKMVKSYLLFAFVLALTFNHASSLPVYNYNYHNSEFSPNTVLSAYGGNGNGGQGSAVYRSPFGGDNDHNSDDDLARLYKRSLQRKREKIIMDIMGGDLI